MSGLVMGLVFEMDISDQFGRAEKYVLLAYADHADQNGGSIYPSVDLMVRKTGYSERAIQQLTRDLERLGLLVPDGMGPSGTNRWRIPVVRTEGGAKIAPPREMSESAPPDAENCTPGMSKTAPEGIAPEGSAPDPLVVVKNPSEEEEGRETQKIELSKSLKSELAQFGVYKSIWPEIEKRLGDGWTEADILALVSWVKSRNGNAGRFVGRVRDGSKAPAQFYPDYGAPDEAAPDEDLPEEPAEAIPPACGGEGARAWEIVLTQLQMDMTRASFDTWVRDTIPVRYEAGELTVAAHSAYARDWLESRLTSTVERLLVGILNEQHVAVRFIACEGVSTETEVVHE